jgi:large conductance mechanosensitive channel
VARAGQAPRRRGWSGPRAGRPFEARAIVPPVARERLRGSPPAVEETMLKEFKTFLLQTNALALAVGVVIGGAIGKVVSSLVSDILMPVIGLGLPGGAWREQKIVLTTNPDGTPGNAITYGSFLGTLIDFVIIAFVIFMITKFFLKPTGDRPAPTKTCPECLEVIPKDARKCRACTSPLPA